MKQGLIKSCLGLAVAVAMTIGIFAKSADAATVNIGTLGDGDSFSQIIKPAGPSFTQDYDFHLDPGVGFTILASGQAKTGGGYGLDSLTVSILQGATVLATASGVPLAGLDTFAQTGHLLGAGDYIFRVFGDVTAGQKAAIQVAIGAVAQTPIPASGLMLLTGLGVLGGLTVRRRRKQRATADA